VALGLALRELQNIHPCTYVQGVLSFDLEALDRWYGVKAGVYWPAPSAMPFARVKRWEKVPAEETSSHHILSSAHTRRHPIYLLTGHQAELKFNQVNSNTGFESPCSTKGESFRFSPPVE